MNKAVFLDRDGIINIDKHYVYKIDDFEFKEGIFELLCHLQKLDYLLFIVTNQSGIGRNYYTINDFHKLTNYMMDYFNKNNIYISQIEFCPHHPKDMCSCRKPRCGMINKILNKHNVNLEDSWFIGDKQSDIECAINSKIVNKIKVHKDLNFKIDKYNNYYECPSLNEIFKIITK